MRLLPRQAVSRLAAALAASGVAFWLYAATLLPGQDLGDTAVFQVIAASGARPTARDAYPLYYFLARQAASFNEQNPARAINMLSAATAALVIAVFVCVAAELTSGLAAAVIAALLFASSYTFWTQAIIAEVYALHLLFVLASIGALLWWSKGPSTSRLALFFAIYALSFGNHLSTILLLPAFAIAISLDGRRVLRPRVVVLAVACAVGGALQYGPMLQALREYPRPLSGVLEVLSAFWVDVTKADWRESLVMGVRPDQIPDRIAMYWFELRQQFGWPAIVVAALGAGTLARSRPRAALTLGLAYAVSFLFAFTYNVGDSHVFFLTSHAIVALWFACGLAAIARLKPGTTSEGSGTFVMPGFSRAARAAVVVCAAAYIAWRAFDTYPAVDRSDDDRSREYFAQMSHGLTFTRDVLVADLNWQQIDGLAYYSTITNPDVVWTSLADVLPRFPTFVRDNHDIGRTVVLNGRARDRVIADYGERFDIQPDSRAPLSRLRDRLDAVVPGTTYVLTWVTPYPDTPVDPTEFLDAVGRLTGRAYRFPSDGVTRYVAIAGRVGEAPILDQRGDRPFRASVDLETSTMLVRFDAWPVFDTIRRAGFGHVIVDRRHVLHVDRGISLAIVDANSSAPEAWYRGGILQPQERFLIRPSVLR